MFGDSQFTSTLSVNFHFPKIPRRTFKRVHMRDTIKVLLLLGASFALVALEKTWAKGRYFPDCWR
uniref:hypothetical protein n=1 Tax=Enterobacter cloacae complex sp. TaxID=2027919 RepID=UPI0021015CE0|nr:hypothetical protein [Enterobacter cloacae complex sp.]